MNDTLTLGLAGMAGLVLGAIFFGGLWWSVRKGMASPRPALWFVSSTVLRMGIALVGFYSIGHEDWRRMMACLAGFVVARILVTRWTRPPVESKAEVRHAP